MEWLLLLLWLVGQIPIDDPVGQRPLLVLRLLDRQGFHRVARGREFNTFGALQVFMESILQGVWPRSVKKGHRGLDPFQRLRKRQRPQPFSSLLLAARNVDPH